MSARKKMLEGELQLKNELELYADEVYSDEPMLDDSVYNPANDEYKRTVASLHRLVTSLTAKLPAKHAMVARMMLSQLSPKEISKKVRLKTGTVYKIRKDPDVQKLARAMIQLRTLKEGVTAIEREQLLWRIALNNEEFNPRTSIAAVAEINKMKTDTAAMQEKIKQNTDLQNSPSIVIQLGDARLQPTLLDVN